MNNEHRYLCEKMDYICRNVDSDEYDNFLKFIQQARTYRELCDYVILYKRMVDERLNK